MNIMVFDIEITGHHPEYIEHLVKYITKDTENNHKYIFVVHPDFCEKFPWIVNYAKNSLIKFVPISELELNNLLIHKKNVTPFWNSKRIFNLLIKYAELNNSDSCIIMYFNRFLKPFIYRKTKFKVYGILFAPQVSMSFEKDFVSKIKYLRSWFIRYLYTRNTRINKIYILNDKNGVKELNKQVRKNVFYYLPDPIPEIENEKNFDVRKEYQIEKSKKILLHFGSLRNSKGTIELIKSLNYLSKEVSLNCCLILAGKPFNKIIEDKILKCIQKVESVQVVFINEFLTNSRMKSFFEQSDIIAIPYKNALASSGVIGHSILSGKPVISTKQGLIGEIIRTYWKGELVELVEPKMIADAIKKTILTEYSEVNASEYIYEHSPYNFAKTILADL